LVEKEIDDNKIIEEQKDKFKHEKYKNLSMWM
jgi:hypothetical protein